MLTLCRNAQEEQEEEKLLGSDDEDGGMASLFSGRLGSSGTTAWGLGGSRLRWVSKARRAPAAAAAAAGAKTRTRRCDATLQSPSRMPDMQRCLSCPWTVGPSATMLSMQDT